MNAQPTSRRMVLFIMIGCAMVGAASCVVAGFRWGYAGVMLAMVSVWVVETLVIMVSYQLCCTATPVLAPRRTFASSRHVDDESHQRHESAISA